MEARLTLEAAGGSRPHVSAVITTLNEERNIVDCITSLLWCDEIIVVDSFSTDRTPELAQSFEKVRFLQRKYMGAASQKNWAMGHARHEWLLFFDADERCTPELEAEIKAAIADPAGAEAFVIKRRVFFMDRVIRFSGWQRDRVTRLVRRGAGRYPNKLVHADMMTRSHPRVLQSSMLHYMIESFDQYLPRVIRYGFWGAAQEWREERSAGVVQVFGRTVWRFLRMYVFQLGFLDGMPGLVFCLLQTFGTYLKWAILWEWRQNARRGRQPALPEFDETEETWLWEPNGSQRAT